MKGKVPNSSSPKGSGTATALTSFVPSTILKPLKAFTISFIRPWTPLKILATAFVIFFVTLILFSHIVFDYFEKPLNKFIRGKLLN